MSVFYTSMVETPKDDWISGTKPDNGVKDDWIIESAWDISPCVLIPKCGHYKVGQRIGNAVKSWNPWQTLKALAWFLATMAMEVIAGWW